MMVRVILLSIGFLGLCAGCNRPNSSMPKAQKGKTLYLVKANNKLISHCKCETTVVAGPAQMGCPWCGCGWLFVCPTCHKAFTFSRAELVDQSWEELAHLDLDRKSGRPATDKQVREWIGFMKVLLKDIQIGKEYVYIDGWVFPTDSKDLRFEGSHSRHQLTEIPQVQGLVDRGALERTLDSEKYWQERRVENK
jgi:hypothetical protein